MSFLADIGKVDSIAKTQSIEMLGNRCFKFFIIFISSRSPAWAKPKLKALTGGRHWPRIKNTGAKGFQLFFFNSSYFVYLLICWCSLSGKCEVRFSPSLTTSLSRAKLGQQRWKYFISHAPRIHGNYCILKDDQLKVHNITHVLVAAKNLKPDFPEVMKLRL